MIYAIILIVLGLIALIFNKKDISKQITLRNAILAPLFIIWGLVGIIILSTIRFSVFEANSNYWTLLIIGSSFEIIIGLFFIYRHFKLKKNFSTLNPRMYLYQTSLAIAAILIGVATMLVK